MRYLEIVLKIAFLILSVAMIVTSSLPIISLCIFLMVCGALGLVLIVNKNASYRFKQTKRDLRLRKIEGVILVVVGIVGLTYLNCLM